MNARQLHESSLVCNLHDDWSIEVQRAFLRGERGGLERTYYDKLRNGGIDFTFYTVGGDDVMFTQDLDLLRGTLRGIDAALEEIDSSQHFTLCLTAEDIVAARRGGNVGLMLTIEGAGPLGEDLAFLRDLYRLGLRSVILTWFKANPTADGVGERRNGGLTSFGRSVIDEMNRLGMLIDVTQCAPATIDDVLEQSSRPMVASHSNCSGVHPHRRNLTDEQLRGIAAGGGMLGVTCYPAHVGDGDVGLDEFFRHIDYAVELVGVEHVGIGLNLVVHDPREAEEFYTRSGIEYSSFQLPGLEDLDRLPVVTEGLVTRGYGHDEIELILGGNLLRVISETVG